MSSPAAIFSRRPIASMAVTPGGRSIIARTPGPSCATGDGEPDRSGRPVRVQRAQLGRRERLDQQVGGDPPGLGRHGGVLDPRPVHRGTRSPEHSDDRRRRRRSGSAATRATPSPRTPRRGDRRPGTTTQGPGCGPAGSAAGTGAGTPGRRRGRRPTSAAPGPPRPPTSELRPTTGAMQPTGRPFHRPERVLRGPQPVKRHHVRPERTRAGRGDEALRELGVPGGARHPADRAGRGAPAGPGGRPRRVRARPPTRSAARARPGRRCPVGQRPRRSTAHLVRPPDPRPPVLACCRHGG